MQALLIGLICLLAGLPGAFAAGYTTAGLWNKRAGRKAAKRAAPEESIVQKNKEYANFFAYDGTEQED